MTKRLIASALSVIAIMLLISSCSDGESESMTAEEAVYAAVDRYHEADSHGTRREVLATFTLDSPKRERYSGSDEDFAISREALNASNYRSQALNKRDLKINGDRATLVADKHTTRDDVPIPIVGKGLLYELKRVDGTWLIYDIGSNVVRPTPPQR